VSPRNEACSSHNFIRCCNCNSERPLFIINHDDDDNTDTLTSFFGIWYADMVKLFVEAGIFTKRRIKVTNLSAFLNIISPDKKTME
jgi:hypothetical protein